MKNKGNGEKMLLGHRQGRLEFHGRMESK